MNTRTKSYVISDQDRKWHVLDASSMTLGRLSSQAAKYLIGKHKVNFDYHNDDGDFVVVINAAGLQVSGKKMSDKKYYRHSGFVGSIKETDLGSVMEKDPRKVITMAVKGMLPRNRLSQKMLKRLKVYTNSEHPYAKHFNQDH